MPAALAMSEEMAAVVAALTGTAGAKDDAFGDVGESVAHAPSPMLRAAIVVRCRNDICLIREIMVPPLECQSCAGGVSPTRVML